jgi:hypothetical protein
MRADIALEDQEYRGRKSTRAAVFGEDLEEGERFRRTPCIPRSICGPACRVRLGMATTECPRELLFRSCPDSQQVPGEL